MVVRGREQAEHWPPWAVERVECANCGRHEYAWEAAPSKGESRYGTWLSEVWPDGRSQQTRLGFFVWCSARCESAWKHSRRASADYTDGWAHQHMLEMDRRKRAMGAE